MLGGVSALKTMDTLGMGTTLLDPLSSMLVKASTEVQQLHQVLVVFGDSKPSHADNIGKLVKEKTDKMIADLTSATEKFKDTLAKVEGQDGPVGMVKSLADSF